jgi:hypothetical protein
VLCFEACPCLKDPREYPESIQPQAIKDDMRDVLRLRPMMNKRGRVGFVHAMSRTAPEGTELQNIVRLLQCL